MNQKNRAAAQTAGWIVWWVELVFFLIAAVVVLIVINHPQILGPELVGYQIYTNIFAGLLIAWHVVVQVVTFIAIKNLRKNDNYLWPIMLIVLGFMGNVLYLIPGIWGLITNSNDRVDNAQGPKPVE